MIANCAIGWYPPWCWLQLSHSLSRYSIHFVSIVNGDAWHKSNHHKMRQRKSLMAKSKSTRMRRICVERKRKEAAKVLTMLFSFLFLFLLFSIEAIDFDFMRFVPSCTRVWWNVGQSERRTLGSLANFLFSQFSLLFYILICAIAVHSWQ